MFDGVGDGFMDYNEFMRVIRIFLVALVTTIGAHSVMQWEKWIAENAVMYVVVAFTHLVRITAESGNRRRWGQDWNDWMLYGNVYRLFVPWYFSKLRRCWQPDNSIPRGGCVNHTDSTRYCCRLVLRVEFVITEFNGIWMLTHSIIHISMAFHIADYGLSSFRTAHVCSKSDGFSGFYGSHIWRSGSP